MTMTVREARIPMPDGVGLAATLYLPATPPRRPVPACSSTCRTARTTRLGRNLELNSYLTRRGIAGARVDIRGTGNSDGELPAGEYTEQEQRDAEDVIAWLADQPWCTGAVGMWGISWGGFNSIQIASRQRRRPRSRRSSRSTRPTTCSTTTCTTSTGCCTSTSTR